MDAELVLKVHSLRLPVIFFSKYYKFFDKEDKSHCFCKHLSAIEAIKIFTTLQDSPRCLYKNVLQPVYHLPITKK